MNRSKSTVGRLLAVPAAAVLAVALAPAAPAGAAAAVPGPGWVGTWGTAPTGAALPPLPVTVLDDQTLRQIVHTSVAGRSVRVRLSNEFGAQPLLVGEAHVARRAAGTEIASGSDRRLSFGGRSSVTIPPGAPALSDPVGLTVPALSDLAVSIYLPQRTPATTLHTSAFQQNYVAAGNVTGATSLTNTSVTTSWFFLTGVSVAASARGASIVALGDSITDGFNTTLDANHRWPDFLARRLQARPELRQVGVLNKGVGGNRLLHDGRGLPGPFEGFGPILGPSALARFDRDVLAQPGVRYVVVLLGINDIGLPGVFGPPEEEVTVADMIAGYRQLIARAHDSGLSAYGATVTPFEGTVFPGYYTAAREAKRLAVNRWIQTSGEWDAVIDFDRAVRDPGHPLRLLPRYDSGDHLHPNDAGMRAMADAIPLSLFRQGLGQSPWAALVAAWLTR